MAAGQRVGIMAEGTVYVVRWCSDRGMGHNGKHCFPRQIPHRGREGREWQYLSSCWLGVIGGKIGVCGAHSRGAQYSG